MPAGDGTGPLGRGPMSGRAAGFCGGNGMPGYANPIPGRGFGFHRIGRGFFGRGRGYRHMYYATGLPFWARGAAFPGAPMMVPPIMTAEQELEALKDQAEFFNSSLEDIQKRIAELESQAQK